MDLKTPLGKKHNMKAGVVQLATKPHPLVFLIGLPWRAALRAFALRLRALVGLLLALERRLIAFPKAQDRTL